MLDPFHIYVYMHYLFCRGGSYRAQQNQRKLEHTAKVSWGLTISFDETPLHSHQTFSLPSQMNSLALKSDRQSTPGAYFAFCAVRSKPEVS